MAGLQAIRAAALAAAVLILPVAAPAAPPLADAVPADSLLYFGWTGAGALGEGFARSDLGKAFADPDLRKMLAALEDRVLASLADRFAEPEKHKPASAAFRTLYDAVRDRPIALALRAAEGEYHAGLVIDLGPSRAAFAAAVEVHLTLFASQAEGLRLGGTTYRRIKDAVGTVEFGFVGDRFFACRGKGSATAFITAMLGKARLAGEPGFAEAVAKTRMADAAAFLYVDVQRWEKDYNRLDGLRLLPPSVRRGPFRDFEGELVPLQPPPAEVVPEKAEPKAEPKDEPKVEPKPEPKAEPKNEAGDGPQPLRPRREEIFGVGGPLPPANLLGPAITNTFGRITRIGAGLQFTDGNCRTAAYLAGGKLEIAKGAAVNAELLRLLPADAEYFAASALPIDRLPELLADSFFDRPRFRIAAGADWRPDFRKAVGADWNKDVLAHLGGTVVYNSPSAGGRWFPGYTLVCEVKNEAALRKAEVLLAKRLRREAKPAGNNPRGFDPNGRLTLREQKEGPYTVYYLVSEERWGPRFAVPAWCLTESHLIVGLYPQVVRAAVRRTAADPDAKSLADRPDFKRLFARLPAGAAAAAGADTGRLLTSLTGLALYFQTALAGEIRGDLDIPVGLVPGLDFFTPHLTPAVSALVPEAGGLRYEGFGGLPLPELAVTAATALVRTMMPEDALRRSLGLRGRFEDAEEAAPPAVIEVEKKAESKPDLKPDEKK